MLCEAEQAQCFEDYISECGLRDGYPDAKTFIPRSLTLLLEKVCRVCYSGPPNSITLLFFPHCTARNGRANYKRRIRCRSPLIYHIYSLAMAEEPSRPDLTASSATIPSDSENYSSSQNELSPSPPSSSSSPMILYSPPTIWGLLRGAAINILLPFVNGLMLGFGELLAHEAAFRLGWSGTKVCVAALLQSLRPESGSLLRFLDLLRLLCYFPFFLSPADDVFY